LCVISASAASNKVNKWELRDLNGLHNHALQLAYKKVLHMHVHQTPQAFFKARYNEVIDTTVECLQRRITNKALDVLVSVEVLLMQSWKGEKCSEVDIESICSHYSAEHNFTTDTLSAQFIGWHCFNHRLELSVGDAVRCCNAISGVK